MSRNMDVDTSQGSEHNSTTDAQATVQNDTTGQSAAEPGSSGDPVSSLRAVALSTLKLKRRKSKSRVALTATPMSNPKPLVTLRPKPDNFIELDYGKADNSEEPHLVKSQSLDSISSAGTEMEDGQMREEGEISDTEENIPLSPPQSKPLARNGESSSSRMASLDGSYPLKRTPPATPVRIADMSPQPALLQRLSDPVPISPPLPFRSSPPKSLDSASTALEDSVIVDENHVRPGLAMNQKQYDTSKDIILDLLGWGVPPEYLVECGLSRQIIFYVFHELNLRLPRNLDTAGLIPYTPESASSLISLGKQTGPLAKTQSVGKPVAFQESLASRITPAPQSLSARLSAATVDSSSITSSPEGIVPPGSPLASAVSPSLHDIEQQRRQELLARKAVQASRKLRVAASADRMQASASPNGTAHRSSSEPKDQDVEMSSSVPTEAVEDFLNSIGPVAQKDSGKDDATVKSGPAAMRIMDRIFGKHEAMQIDEPIPGFVTTTEGHPATSAEAGPSFTTHAITASPSSTIFPDTPTSAAPPPSSSASADTTFSTSSGVASSSSGGVTPVPDNVPAPISGSNGAPERSRRGVRPKAVDFVDIEPRPGSNGASYSYAGGYMNGLSRRKQGSFASISSMRRCVIDVSDSEDEDSGAEDRQGSVDRTKESRSYSTHTHPLRIGRVFAQQNASSGRSTPASHGGAASGLSGPMSPAALQEKEEEIRQMKELIAKREESRLKKLAMSGRSTPITPMLQVPSATPTPRPQVQVAASGTSAGVLTPGGAVLVKQEDEDSGGGLATYPSIANGDGVGPAGRRDVVARPANGDIVMFDETSPELHRPGEPSVGLLRGVAATGSASSGTSAAAPSPIDDRVASYAMKEEGDGEDGFVGDQVITAEAGHEQAVHEAAGASLDRRRERAQLGAPAPQQRPGARVDADLQGSPSTQVADVRAKEASPQAAPVAAPLPLGASQSGDVTAAGAGSAGVSDGEGVRGADMSAGFATYDSPLDSYPLLRMRLRHLAAGTHQQEQQQPYSFASSYYFASARAPQAAAFPSPSPSSPSYSSLPDLGPLRRAALLRAVDPQKRVCQYEVPGGGVCRDAACGDVHLGRVAGGVRGGGERRTTVWDAEPNDEDAVAYLHGVFPVYRIEDVRAAWASPAAAATATAATSGAASRSLEERVAGALALLAGTARGHAVSG